MRPFLCALLLILSVVSARAANWQYTDKTDPMGRGEIKTAYVVSGNTVTFGFPYQGPQRARLTLRIHPQYGRDVILEISRGQFTCRMDRCQVLARVDDRAPVNYSAVEPNDGSHDTLFIRNYDGFVRNLHGAKTLRIEAEFFQQGTRIFEFDVSDLRWLPATKPAAPKQSTAATPIHDNTTQQARMKSCNTEAGELKGDDRRQFMNECLARKKAEKP